jgi:hypothetical protein
MNVIMTPCFYCEKPAEYVGNVEKVETTLKIVDVCKDHFEFPGAS